MYLPVVIPFDDGGNIGVAYNHEMSRLGPDDWIVFLDYDVMICNPWWKDICVRSIQTFGSQAGVFTCFTNRIGCKLQIAAGVNPESHDMLYHQQFAAELWKRNQFKCCDCTDRGGRFSGMFLMTSKRAWTQVGGFKTEGLFHVDVDYYDKVKKAGMRTYLMAGLYAYHRYLRESTTGGKPMFVREAGNAIPAKGAAK